MTVALRPHPGGTLPPVRVPPGARSAGLAGLHAGSLRMSVSAVPERGKANDAARDVLATALEPRPSRVELIRGATARAKLFLIHDINPDELRARIEAAPAASFQEDREDA